MLTPEQKAKQTKESILKDIKKDYDGFCEHCKTKLLEQFRYTDWENESEDEYFDNEKTALIDCIEYYIEKLKYQSNDNISIYDVSYCPECDENNDKGIYYNKNEKV